MRILFMGGHELGKLTLEYLIAQGRNIIGAVITATDDQWYKGVDEAALKYNLPLFKEKNINDPAFIEKVKALHPDLIAVVNFEQILKEDIIGIPPRGCINTHASLLPKYRGRAPLNWAMLNGEKETGVTVHYIEKGIDTGDIISQVKIEINESDYIEDLLGKAKKLYPLIVDEAIEKIQKNRVNPIKQELSKGFYCGKRTARDGQIKWEKPAGEILNLIRAVSRPYPGAYTYYGTAKVVIWKAVEAPQTEEQKGLENGTVLEVKPGYLMVKSEGGNLKLTEYEMVNDENNQCSIKQDGKFSFKED